MHIPYKTSAQICSHLTKLLIIFAVGLVACDQDLPPDKEYPEPWQQSVHAGLVRTLANHQARGCGGMWWRESKTSKGTYLVYCTKDGAKWTMWLVQPLIDGALGPHNPYPEIPPPY
jgi:hypothetical protein